MKKLQVIGVVRTLRCCKRVAYLETNKESNVSLYKYYDSELKQQETIPKTNVAHYVMARRP